MVTLADLKEVLKALLTPSDVTNPTELREALRGELGGSKGVLGSPRLILRGSKDAIYGKYVAMPKVIQHPHGETPVYMIFHGWSTPPPGLDRKLYICTLSENFVLSGVRLLLDYKHFGPQYDSLEAPCTIYDEVNDGWIMLVCVHDSTVVEWRPSWKMAFLRWNKDLTHITHEYFPINITPSSLAPEEWRPLDGGCSLLTLAKGVGNQGVIGLTYIAHSPVAGDPTGLYWLHCVNIETNPPTFTRARVPAFYTSHSPFTEMPLMPCLFDLGETLGVLIDSARATANWNLTIGYLTPTSPSYSIEDRIGGISGKYLPVQDFFAVYGMIHPYITSLPDSTLWNLFYAVQGPKGYEHSIWAVTVNPDMLRPINQESVMWLPWYNQSIAINEVCIPFSGLGKKTIYFTSSAVGNLTVQADPAGRGEWYDLYTVPNTTQVTQTYHEALQMRLKFSAAATVTARIVQSFW